MKFSTYFLLALFFYQISFISYAKENCLQKILDEISDKNNTQTSLDTIDIDSISFSKALENLNFNDLFHSYTKTYFETIDVKTLKKIIKKIEKSKNLSKNEQVLFNDSLAAIKKLRNAFISFSDNHYCPAELDELATVIGHLKDAKASDKTKYLSETGKKLTKFFEKKDNQLAIKNQIAQFHPSTNQSLQKWIDEQIIEVKRELISAEVTPRTFHEIRKKIARLQIIYSSAFEASAKTEIKPFLDYVTSIYKEMGPVHDELMDRRIAKTLDYEHGAMIIPKPIKEKLQRLVDLFPQLRE